MPSDPSSARDLGFGTRIAGDSRRRLLNRDGSFNVERRGARGTAVAPYHALLSITWTRFLGILAVYYLAANAVFALAYLACGPAALNGQRFVGHTAGVDLFLRAYFFSVETFSTVGYGSIVPVSVAANFVMTIEAFAGLVTAALAAGLIFARFSRPNAAIVYSKHALIAPYRNISAFMFRCANERNNQLIEVSVRLIYSRLILNANGERVRDFTILPLEFEKVTFFTLSWTVVHPIDDSSPLAGVSAEDLRESEAEFMILLSGTDDTFSQTVHSRTSYKPQEIVWHARFRPMFVETRESGTTGMDLSLIHDYVLVGE